MRKSEIQNKLRQGIRQQRDEQRRRQDTAIDEYSGALASRIMAEQALADAKDEVNQSKQAALKLGVSRDELKTAEEAAGQIVNDLAAAEGEAMEPAADHDDDGFEVNEAGQ
ncbi:MAG: hypothetical protein LKI77_06855 [Bifidobacterium sp.]|jgi:hypothetical protein|nr:hypothetical protein [Bifidobacterium sp.]